MRGLSKLIYKYHVFLVFIVLELVAFSFLTRYNSYHSSAFLNATNGISTALFAQQNRIQSLLQLQENNDSLALELAMMKSRESDFYQFYETSFQVVEDSSSQQSFRFFSAGVVNASTNKASNYLTINKGSLHGLSPEMAVVSDNALVGLVKDVSENFATVMPMINANFQVSVMLKSKGDFGMASWDTKSPYYAVVKDIPKEAKVNVGDSIVTSSFGAYFPPNVMVGTVSEAEVSEGQGFYTVRVKLSADFQKLRYVEVIENLLREEQLELESKLEEDV